ncbi:MAG: hypothetical protein V5788_03045 [Shewanella sp.]
MISRSDSQFLQQMQSLLAPYGKELLSAFDNMKLVVAVISAKGGLNVKDLAQLEVGIAYEVTLHKESSEIEQDHSKNSERYYCVKWQNIWVNCGLTNNYSVSIELLTDDIKIKNSVGNSIFDGENEVATGKGVLNINNIEACLLREVHVPILSLQQIEFMCMEYAHFDHC